MQCLYNYYQLFYRISVIKIGVVMVINIKEVILLVFFVNIISVNSFFKFGNVLLDLGVQMEIMEIFGLNRKDIFVIIIKVGGEEEMIKMKEYKVQLVLIDNDKRFIVKVIRIFIIMMRLLQLRFYKYWILLVYRI